ncbi:hypothetical protein BSKO_13898 [Bryopsis sp. KO-2023]|nr:hypothetical protein BSKO_13898 [Bryopsis sp. KO-2023]
MEQGYRTTRSKTTLFERRALISNRGCRMSAAKAFRNPSVPLPPSPPDVLVSRLDVTPAGPPRTDDSGLVGKMVAAVEAIQGPRTQADGVFRDLLSNDSESCIAVGGHRGMGENLWNDDDPLNLPNLWRENTIKSFLKACQYGITFVEFDVQVTKDDVPVIWHDDKMIFGSPFQPISCEVKDLTLQEFRSIGPRPIDKSGSLRELIPLQRDFTSRTTGRKIGEGRNMWQCFDDDQLPTFREVCELMPEHVGLNVEVKMTTPDTVARTDPAEVDRVVSAVLDTLSDYLHTGGTSRKGPIVLSSFDPDVVLELQKRQSDCRVMFITTGGASPHANPLRMSPGAAIDFGSRNELAGVVFDTSVLRKEPHWVRVGLEKGLKVLTYGLGNNDSEWVSEQSGMGVHAAIVDDVANMLPVLVGKWSGR